MQSHGRHRQRMMTTDHVMHGKKQQQPHTRSGTLITFDVCSRVATTTPGAGVAGVAGVACGACGACGACVAGVASTLTTRAVGEAGETPDTGGRTVTDDTGGTTNGGVISYVDTTHIKLHIKRYTQKKRISVTIFITSRPRLPRRTWATRTEVHLPACHAVGPGTCRRNASRTTGCPPMTALTWGVPAARGT